MATVVDLLSSLPTSPKEIIKLGADLLQDVFIKLKDNKTRKVLKQLDESLSKFQPVFILLKESEYRIALNALQETRDAKDFLFATDLELRVLALETIKTTEQCKKIVDVLEKKPEKTTKCCEYIEKTMKSLMERSKLALDTATKKFLELHAKINKIVGELDKFLTKLELFEGDLKDKKKDAQKAATPGFWGNLFGWDYSEEEKVVEKYENKIGSVKAAKQNKKKIEEMLKQTKEDIEAAQQRLTDWLALVNKNADGYDQGDHAQTLIDLDSALLKEEFDELKDVCEAYIAHCITDEKNKIK